MPAKTKSKKKQNKIKTKPKPKASKKKALKSKSTGRKPIAAKKRKPARKVAPKPAKKKVVAKRRRVPPKEFSVKRSKVSSGRLSGDLQGVSRVEDADSESVAELLEEGNTFEAEILSGVEAADDGDDEVETHEVPEDDVPGEYLDED
jgi:hypothetical protein